MIIHKTDDGWTEVLLEQDVEGNFGVPEAMRRLELPTESLHELRDHGYDVEWHVSIDTIPFGNIVRKSAGRFRVLRFRKVP